MSRYARILALALTIALASQATPAGALAEANVKCVSATGSTVWIAGSPNSSRAFFSRSTDMGVNFTAYEVAGMKLADIDAMPDGLTAWAVSDRTRYAYRTTDGGPDFGAVGDVFGGAGYLAHGIAALPGGAIGVVGEHNGTEFGDLGAIWRTYDLTNWNTMFEGPIYETPDPGTGDPVDPILTYAQLYSIDTTCSDRVVWAIGNELNPATSYSYMRPLIYKSEDGGSTWTTQTATAAMTSSNDVWSITAASTSTAFIGIGGASASRILRTTDGGNTWAPVIIDGFTGGYYNINSNGVHALDENHLLVVGSTGKIAWTSSASETSPTWTHYRIQTGYPDLYEARMLDATHWVVVGDNETIYRTSNGGATWAGSSALTAPSIRRLTPASGFSLNAGAVSITGTSTDVGVGVAKVEVRLRRADGLCWDGLQWVSADTWLKASPSGAGTPATWASWSYSWMPDAALLASGQIVTVQARATDGMGLQTLSTSVSSAAGQAGTPAISLVDGAVYASSRVVTASVSPEGFMYMRHRVDAAAPSAWVTSTATEHVDLGVGDGLKTVVFDFSLDASTTSKSATDTIILDATAPTASVTSPASLFVPVNLNCSGVAADTGGSGVQGVEVKIRSGDSYWDGGNWIPTQKWLAANGTTTWSYTQLANTTSLPTTLPITITARAIDVAGNIAESAPVSSKSAPIVTLTSSSGGPVAYSIPVTIAGTFTVNGAALSGQPVRVQRISAATGAVSTVADLVTGAGGRYQTTSNMTENSGYRVMFLGSTSLLPYTSASTTVTAYARLSAATLPATIYRNRTFSVSGKLEPRHLAGTSGVKLELWRQYRRLDGALVWKYVRQVPARLSDTAGGSTYAATAMVPYAGTWRIRAVHSDASHALTTSAFKTFSVR